MNIPRSLKLLILACTLWIPLYMLGFMVMFTHLTTASFDTLLVVHGATMAASVVLLVVYMVHLFKTTHVQREQKALWGVALLLGSPIAMPIYWFAHLWPDTRPSWPLDCVDVRRR